MPRSARPTRPAPQTGFHTVLIAVSGLTPAIITETVWALARETPPTIPDQIIVLTTETGRARIAEQLFGEERLWERLRAALLGPRHAEDPRLDFDCTPDRVKVFHRRVGTRRLPITDLASLADNKAIADALVDELWQHTSKPDTRVIASLAGGYKTMSALCLSAMQLLANSGDRVTHVLVGGGYDKASPGFFFPEQPQQRLVGPSGPLQAAAAANKIQLIEVPVIPLRRWFEDLLHTKPPSYDVLLSQGAAALHTSHAADLHLALGPIVLPPGAKSRHFAVINDHRLHLSTDQFAYLRFFAERSVAGQPAFERAVDVIEELAAWLTTVRTREPRFYRMSEAFDAGTFTADSLGKRLSDLRTFLKQSSPPAQRLAALLPGKGHWTLQLPPAAIELQ